MMLDIASLIVANLVIAGIIGFIIGYLLGKSNSFPKIKSIRNGNKIDDLKSEKVKHAINPIFKKNSTLDFKPLILTSPKPTGKDSLIKIKGIDEKIENDLNNLGIYHFEQISKWSNKNCEWIEEFLLLPGIARSNQWVEQAKILLSGKDTSYSLQVENGEIARVD
jgi:predicted flap endonuclease-1-like 5' DNA nuclease